MMKVLQKYSPREDLALPAYIMAYVDSDASANMVYGESRMSQNRIPSSGSIESLGSEAAKAKRHGTYKLKLTGRTILIELNCFLCVLQNAPPLVFIIVRGEMVVKVLFPKDCGIEMDKVALDIGNCTNGMFDVYIRRSMKAKH